MTYKKTWLSYLLWAIFTCVTGIMLANYAILFWKGKINAGVGYYTIGFVFLIFAAVAGCFFLMRKLFPIITEKHRISEQAAFLWEIFIILGVLTAGLVYRVSLVLQSGAEIPATDYYQLATVKESGRTEMLVHGISHLYTKCLSFVLSFLGNKVTAAVWMQVFLHMLAMLIAYFAVRKLAGKLPACVTALVLALSSVFAGQILSITPESFFFVLYMAGMLLVGSYVNRYNHGGYQKRTALIGAAFSGIAIGALTYLDMLSLTLLILPIGLITGIRQMENTPEKEKYVPLENRFSILAYILVLCGSLVGLVLLFVVDAAMSGTEVKRAATAWIGLYRTHLSADYVLYQTDRSMIESFVLVMLSTLLTMAFWIRRKTQNVSPWICLMLLLAPTPLAKVGVLPYQVFAVFIWSVLAGIGLQQSFTEEEIPEKIRTVEEKEALPGKAAETAGEKKPMEAPESKPRFLENPLPVPKKHERKEMDYQYKVAEEKMKFDIDIREGDDFDIS